MEESILSFKPSSKQEWLDKINKDLRSKSVDSLYSHYNDQIVIDPFAHKDDQNDIHSTMTRKVVTNDWYIGININIISNQEAHSIINKLLSQGLSHIQLKVHKNTDFNVVFEDVFLDMVKVDLYFDDIEIIDSSVKDFKQFISKNNYQQNKLDIVFLWEGSVDKQDVFFNKINENIPEYAGILIKSSSNGVEELAEITQDIYLKLNKHKTKDILTKIRIELRINTQFLIEIPRIRALKKLWFNLLKNVGVDLIEPDIVLVFDQGDYEEAAEDNLILQCVQSIAGAIGGISSIVVGESTSSKRDDSFYQRIALNIHNVLKMESKIDLVQDPVAGSYHFEKLTDQFFSSSWNKFLEQ